MADGSFTLPSGVRVVTHVSYTPEQSRGPLALAVTASISLCAVIAILIAMAVAGFKTRHQFVRSQVGTCFLSLVLSDLLQATGSLMNARWVVIEGVTTGPFCTTQAALKQTGNVGTALWSLVIAIHTFSLLFLRLRIGAYVFYSIVAGVWLFQAFVVIMGPLIIQTPARGQFWGISGYWCWITNAYMPEQVTDEYLFMFTTAFVSFILYSLIFLRLRGNLPGFGWNFRLHRVKEPWVDDDVDESQMSAAGKQMLWQVAYTIIILPIAACRLSTIFGHKVPYPATMAADSIFMLSGFVNAILYSATRKIVSVRALLPFSRLIRIGSLRSANFTSSKASLDAMEFSTPTSPPKGNWHVRPAPPVKAAHLWHPHGVRDDLGTHHGSPPGLLSKVDGLGPGSDTCHVFEYYASPEPPPHSLVSVGRARSASDPHGDARFSRPRTPTQEPAHDAPARRSLSRAPSDTSLTTTDGAPTLHHKRFSGWSLPSVRGAAACPGELEEMRFAAPSPDGTARPRVALTRPPSPAPAARWPACPTELA